MKKNILFALLIVLLSVSVIGCQKKEEKAATPTKTESTKAEKVLKSKIFVSQDWVKSVIDGNQEESKNYVIVEGSWGPVKRNKEYLKAHLPHAIHINTDDLEHAGEPGVKDRDNYNIRPADVVEKTLLQHGIDKDTTVIVYGSTVGASRVAFILLWAGVEDVKLMDGNITTWEKKNYPTESGEVKLNAKKDFGTKVPAHPEWIIDDKTVYKDLSDKNFRLVSIRSTQEYEGKTSGYPYIDYAGEPKGALWGHAGSDAYHLEDYMDENSHYVDYQTVEKYMNEIHVTKENKTSFYCGTGWRACIPFLILHENGWKNITIYDGGWWQWLTNPDYPVQLGDPRKGDVKEVKVKDLEKGKAVKN